MLERPPPTDADRKERRRRAQRDYRRRYDAGCMVVPVEVDGAMIAMLIATGWLIKDESEDHKKRTDAEPDRAKIGQAITALLADTAKGS